MQLQKNTRCSRVHVITGILCRMSRFLTHAGNRHHPQRGVFNTWLSTRIRYWLLSGGGNHSGSGLLHDFLLHGLSLKFPAAFGGTDYFCGNCNHFRRDVLHDFFLRGLSLYFPAAHGVGIDYFSGNCNHFRRDVLHDFLLPGLSLCFPAAFESTDYFCGNCNHFGSNVLHDFSFVLLASNSRCLWGRH